MGPLLDNPIADLAGPTFLGVYAAFAFSVALLAWLFAYRDPTRWMDALAGSGEPDPYELAWMRQGFEEGIRVVVFSLHLRGYLQRARPGESYEPAPAPPDERHLTPLERAVCRFYRSGDPAGVAQERQAYEKRLLERNLLTPPAAVRLNSGLRVLSMGLVGALGLYEMAVSLVKGQPVGFLLVLWLVALVVCALVVPAPGRLTDRGQRYLCKQELALAEVRDHVPTASSGVAEQVDPRANEPTLALLLAVFGAEVLVDTAFEHLLPRGLPSFS